MLFWAEIYHQARSLPTGPLRPAFLAFNVAVYAVQAGLWALAVLGDASMGPAALRLSGLFLAAASLAAAAGFVTYGGRLFVMLQRFPIESKGRRKKLREVGAVTAICAACFTLRAVMVAAAAADADELSIDVAAHPLVNVAYYGLAELLPTALVLFILRKLPPKRAPGGYQPLPAGDERGAGASGSGGSGTGEQAAAPAPAAAPVPVPTATA